MADRPLNLLEIRRLLADQATEPDPEATNFAVTKQQEEDRYTLGIMYVPGARDSDDEYTTADELQKACWEFMRKGNRRVRDTHSNQEIGELVELVSWPYDVVVEAPVPGEETIRKYALPAGTVFAGVIWETVAWPYVKSGRLRGYSLGGRAVRMKEASTDSQLPRMRDLARRGAAELDVVFTPAAKDAPYPIQPGDRVAESSDDLSLGKAGTCFALGVDSSDGVITHDVIFDDDSVRRGVRGMELRRLGDPTVEKDQPGGPIPNKPGVTNWVERAGGLPRYVRQIAEDLIPKHGVSGAIRLAAGIVKNWCQGKGNVTAKTRTKACKAFAEWKEKAARKSADPLGELELFILDEVAKTGEPTDDEIARAEAQLRPETLAELLA